MDGCLLDYEMKRMSAEDITDDICTRFGKDEYVMSTINSVSKQNAPVIDESTTFFDLQNIITDQIQKMNDGMSSEVQTGMNWADIIQENSLIVTVDEEETTEHKTKRERRPGAVFLRENCTVLTKFQIGTDGSIEVFTNGYAVYDNGNRKTVLWIFDCGSTSYYFTPLKESEKNSMIQCTTIDQEELGNLPWFYALVIAGENRIEYNLEHPKSEGTNSDFITVENYEMKRAPMWYGSVHFDNPEEAYLRKEAKEARIALLTDKQREVYELYYEDGYTLQEIAERLQISFRTVADRIDCIKTKLKKKSRNLFEENF